MPLDPQDSRKTILKTTEFWCTVTIKNFILMLTVNGFSFINLQLNKHANPDFSAILETKFIS